jgi:hypothetical protein
LRQRQSEAIIRAFAFVPSSSVIVLPLSHDGACKHAPYNFARNRRRENCFESRPAGGTYLPEATWQDQHGEMKMNNRFQHHAKGEQGNRQIGEQKSALTIEKTGYLQFRFWKRPRKRES